jgi:broad specificity phosphatase PhoE
MTLVILVRHGQTAWNRAERFRGHSDVPLNSTGLAQAHAAARRIVSTWRVDAVYTSPLRRAQETAQAIAQRSGLKAQPWEGLIDLNFGAWQGLTFDEAAAAYPDEYALWQTKPQRLRLPGGESMARARRRSSAAMLALATAHPQGTIVLVSHQVICRLLALAALGLSTAHYWQIQQETTAINVFEYVNGGWVTVTLNDTCHLREAPL